MPTDFDYEKLAAELERDEGFVRHAYRDSRGYWTIGIGRLVDEWVGGGITKDEALYLLRNDVAEAERTCDRIEPRWRQLDADRQRVLLNMALNLGHDRFRGFVDFWRAIGDYLTSVERDQPNHLYVEIAAAEMQDSAWYRQVGHRGPRLAARMRASLPPTEG